MTIWVQTPLSSRTVVKVLLLIGVVCCFSSVFARWERPNYSGTWKLNLEASNLGPLPAPRAMTLQIEHKDPELKVTTIITGGPQGDLTYDAKYETDGRETINRLADHDAHCTAAWEGDTLVLRTKADFGGGGVEILSRWKLLEAGKVLKQSAHVSSPQGSFDPTYVFDKETN